MECSSLFFCYSSLANGIRILAPSAILYTYFSSWPSLTKARINVMSPIFNSFQTVSVLLSGEDFVASVSDLIGFDIRVCMSKLGRTYVGIKLHDDSVIQTAFFGKINNDSRYEQIPLDKLLILEFQVGKIIRILVANTAVFFADNRKKSLELHLSVVDNVGSLIDGV